jgi:5-methylcytosine-specific restriction endonuclease McrA
MTLTHVLLLNASYEPLRLITVQRAVNLMLSGKVRAVEGIAARLRTPRTVFEVPAVLSLKYSVNVPRRGVSYSRRAVLRRDGWTCIYCGAQPGDRQRGGQASPPKDRGRALVKADFTVDHIIPRSRGGRSTWTNTACACYGCNQRKANRTPHEAGMALRFEPRLPRTNYLVFGGEMPRAWRKYVEV